MGLIEINMSSETPGSKSSVSISPSKVFGILKLYGPDKIDPMVLVACVNHLLEKGRCLCRALHMQA